MNRSLRVLLVMFFVVTVGKSVMAQGTAVPNYCTNITATNVANYGMGIQNVTLNTTAIPTQINNNTSPGTGTPIYFDYTSQVLRASANETVNYSIKGGSSNQTLFRIYIDYNNDGTFATSGSELVYTSANLTTANTVVTGTFTIPSTQQPGVYRIRIASDGQGNIPQPCGPLTYSADFEDYTLLVPNSSVDVQAYSFSSPSSFIIGNNTIGLKFFNLHSTTVTSADIGYQLGSNTPVTQSLSSISVAQGSSYSATFSTQLNIASSGTYTLRAWVTNPNGNGTGVSSNDTIYTTFTVCDPLNGTYTINPAGSGATNFTSFASAISTMSCGGVSGPVVFNVAAGTYNEQISIPVITGASATNTITIQSATLNAADVTLSFAATGANNYVLNLNGCDYVTFNKMTISNSNTGCCNNNVILIGNGSDYNTFRSCSVYSPYTTNGYLVYENNTNDNYNSFVGNTFTNGSAGVFINGNNSNYPRNNRIDSNTFVNQYNYAIYAYYQDTLSIRSNTISTNSTTTFYGIYSWYASRKANFSFNRINTSGGTSTTYGIYFAQMGGNGSGAGNCLISNNFIQAGAGATTAYGFYQASTITNTDIVHNTVYVSTATGTGVGLYSGTTMNNCRIGNNIFHVASTSASAYALQTSSTSWINSSDTLNFNNYYTGGTNLIKWGGTVYTPAQFASYTYQTASTKDYASQNKQVFFSSSLYHSSSCLAAAGTNAYNSSVAVDIDGVTRNTTNPCIGATEYTTSAYDVAVSAITAPTSYSASAQTVSFTVRNNGTTTITAFDAGYHVNYGTTVSETFSSLNITACSQTTLSFTTQVSLPTGISVLRVFNSGNLNGSNADANQANDTAFNQYSGGMSGTYTINPGAAPSNTNFQTFTAAISALSSTAGVTGPVTFNVSAGTYNEQLIIPAITGSSTTNTITFDGGTAANTIVTCAGTSTNYSVFRLSNTSHIRLQNLTIRNTGATYGWGIHIYTTTAGTNLKVKNCIIKNTSTSAVTGTSTFAGIVASGSLTSPTTSTGVAMTTIELDSNTVDSAYYGIIVYSSTSYSSGVTIRKNTLTNIYYYPVYSYYLYGANVSNNTITLTAATSTTSSMGMYFSTCNTTGSNPTYINGNNIYGAGNYGIYLTSCAGSATAQCQLNNNMVRGGFRVTSSYGIYLSTVSYFNIYHNSVNMDFATTSNIYSCIYQTGGTANTCNFRNNNFAYTSSGSGYAAYLSTTNTVDFNNYYKFGAISSTAVAYYGGYGTLTQASLSGGSQNANSVSTNPNFISATDLHVTDGCLLGTNAGVTTDIDGDSRSTTPTMGADEYTRLNNDIGISALLYPSAPASPGTQQIIATLKNFGLNTITSATVKYSVNGSTPVSVSWSGTLASCGTTSVTFTGANQYTFTGGANEVKVWTELPNSTTDARAANDTNTTTLQICNGLSGAYTINPGGSGSTNYLSFAAAKADLVSCGVSGPVTFTVAAGTYTEQLLLPAITGASSTNTITFDGGTGNASSRIITYSPSTSTAAYTVRLNGSSYVRFKNLTIRSTGSTYANAFHIMGASHYSQIKNCIIEITGAGATATGSNYIPLLINNTADISSPSTGSQVNFLEIDSNTINSGYYNIYMYGFTSSPYSNSNKIRYNTLNSAYQYALYFYFQDGIRIQNNTLALRTTGSSNSYGIYCPQSINSGTNYAELSANKITDAGGYGMYLSNVNGLSSLYRNKIINNMIGGGFRTTSSYGVYLVSCQYTDFWHNTINMDYAGSSLGTAALYSNSTAYLDIRNNIFVVSATSGSQMPVYVNTASDPISFDYNNFYNASNTNLIYLGGTYLTASTYQGFAAFNGNSVNLSVSFTSNSNLHHSNACINGTPISYVTTDFDGQTRGSTPDMGADEVSGANNDLGVYYIYSPGSPFTAGLQDVKVVIRNYGTNTITSGSVSYTVNGGSPVTQAWTGSLASCDTAVVTFTGANQFNFVANTSYTLVATVSSPNGGTDNNSSNDTYTRTNLMSGMIGNYTINPSGSGSTNYITFAAAVTALQNRGVAGEVTFTISAATYNEQVTITSIPGISATKTVTFDGVSNATRILQNPSTYSGSFDHVVKIDNVQYVTFKNLTIKSGTYYGAAVHIYGNSHYTKIKNCVLQIYNGYETSTTTYNNFPLVINNSVNFYSPTTGSYVYGLEIDSNTMIAGYANIWFYGTTSTPYSNNNKFRYNSLRNAYAYGAYFYYGDGIEFTNDSIYCRSGSTASYGLYMSSCTSTGTNYHKINNNKVTNAYAGGFYLTTVTSASSSVRNQMVNNMIGGLTTSTNAYGIYMSSASNFDMFFNSINVNTAVTTTGYGACYLSGGTGLDIRNNIFAHTNSSATAVPFYSPSTMSSVLLSASSFNYNNFYTANATTNRATFSATTYTTTTLLGGGGYNSNSLVSTNPSFTSATDLHVTNSTMNGVTISGYSTDIDGVTRVNPPDMGADEIPNLTTSLDMAMDSIITPGNPNTSVGATTISVRLKNIGSTTLTSATVKYSVNGGTAVSESWSGSLAQNATATFSFATTYTTSFGTAYTLRVWTEAPNSGTDSFMNNDTLSLVFTPKMSGVYTIDASGSGATNFTSFAACSTALALNGVNGPVTINVAAATYTGQVIIPAIPGASSTNTITIDGGSASTTILTTATTTSTATYTIRLNGTSYVHLRNLTIRGTNATYGWPVHIMNSNNVKVRNCYINFVGATTPLPTGNSNFHGIVVNNSTSSYSTSYAATNIDLDSNNIRGGYSGIYVAGSSATGINIRNNTLDSCDTYGIFISSGNGVTVNNNTLNMYTVTAGTYGIYLSSCTSSGTNYHQINGNSIKNAGYAGIYLASSSNPALYKGQLYNNMISEGFRTAGLGGIYSSSSAYWNIYYNTVNYDLTSGYALYVSNSGQDVRNNMLVCSATSGTAYPFYTNSASYPTQFDYNNFYSAISGTPVIVNIAGTTYTSATYIGAQGFNYNSKNLAPGFAGTRNLHLTNGCFNGATPISGLTTDIDGNTRSSTSPEIGADEVIAVSNNIGVDAIVSPTAPLTAGTQNVVIRIKNYGGNTITSANVSYKVNGGSATTVAWTGSLAPCDTVSVYFTGANQYNFASGGSYSVQTYTDGPNGNTDVATSNDTLTSATYCTGMTGTYTINPGGSGATNYTSFAAAVAALQCGGVSGPVTFNVAAGTYSEQVVIPAITGASATNTITFDGGSAANAIIDFSASTTTAAHTVRIDNASYINLRNLTLHGSGSAYANTLHIYGACNYVKVKNCVIDITGAGTVSTSTNFAAVVINGSTSVSSSTGSRPTYLEIDSNTIQYGYYGIFNYALTSAPHATNLKFRSNSIDSSYQYGYYAQNYIDTLYLNNNTVNLRITGSASAYGIYLSSIGSFGSTTYYCEITGNKIINAGQYGIYASVGNTSSTVRSKVNNNMIGGGFRSTSSYGFYATSFYNIDFFYNTIVNDAATTLEQYGAAYFTSCLSIDARNNILVVSNSAATGLPFYSVSGVTYSSFNYNNFYKAGTVTNLLYSQGGYQTPANFVGTGGYNINSINRSVAFLGTTNLHSTDAACFNGQYISSVTTDFDGQTRGTTPDMGADENPAYANDVAVDAIVTPVAPLASGLQDVKIRIRNAGSNTITAATVKYKVNGGSAVTVNWTGTLVPCDTTTVTFTGANQYNFAAGGTYSLQAYTSGANSTTDPNASNDTINGSSMCTGYAGTYTINPSGSGSTNFTSFGAAITALSCGGVTGPVEFDVASGTYNEQVTIPAINGTSAVNTITFESTTGNAADVILTYNSTVSTSNYVVRLNGADYVTLEDMTLTASNTTYGHVIEFTNGATNDSVYSCILNGIATTSTSTNYALVYSSGTRDHGSVVTGCTLNYGSYGVYWSGITSTPYVTSAAITDNTFNGIGYQAIYLYYHSKSYIKGNTINLHNGTATTFYGIYEQNCWNGTRILKNRIVGSTNSSTNTYGISSYQPTGTSSDSGLVANNVVAINQSSGTVYGLYSYLPQWSKVYHNSINITGSATTVYAAYLYSSSATYSNNTAWNNIFVNRCTGATAYAVYFYNAAQTGYYYANYNNLWSSGTNLGSNNGTGYTTLATWYASSGTPDVNSTNKLPGFTSATDLHHTTPCINNTGYIGANSFVTDDMDGNARSATTPDAGAYEFAGTAYDAAAGNITAPTGWSASAQTVTFRVINRGSTTITSLDAGYNVNGGSVTSQTFTSLSIAPCDSATLSFTTQVTLSAGQSVLRVFTKGNINSGNSDASAANDTAQGTICNALSGTYTINPSAAASGTNFQSFATAIAALSSCGVSGAVTVNVAAGTYNEQVTIPYFSGGSATNTVSFEGADSSTTIISYNTAVSASRYVVKFNGARYTSFRNFKVTSPNTTQAWGIQVTGAAATDTSIRIARCTVVLPNINSSNFAGIVATNSTTVANTTGNYTQALTIDSCTVSGGYYGIVINGLTTTAGSQSDRNVVRGCRIINVSYYGIYAYCQSQFTATANTITGVGVLASNVSSYGLYLNYCDSFTATKNIITGQIGAYGLYPSNCNGGSGQHNLIANNMIQIGSGTSTCYGIYMTTACSYTDMVYNSVNVTGSATTFNGCALYISSPTSATIINNNFVNSGSAGYSVYMTPTGNGTTNFAQCDYNNYYATVSNYINGSYANAAAFAGVINSGSDAASKSVTPNFTSSTDLHTPSATALNAAATPYTGVTDDIDGNSRNGSTPDIGCDEFNPPSDDMGVIAISKPVPPVAAGASDVWVVIKNYAATTLTSATVKYVYNSTTYSQSWSGSLATNATDTVKFTATSGAGSTSQQSTFAAGSNSLIAYSEAPNGNTDGILSNDTFSYSFCTGLSGTYTINPSGSGSTNYTTIAAAISALQCGGVSGAVVFNIASGTYTGQYIIPSIAGASSTNTITFQSAAASASAVTLQNNSTVSTANYIFRLYAADYIKFSRLTFSAQNATYGQCIEITANGSDYATNNTVQFCTLNANSTGSSCSGIYAVNSTQPNNLTVYGNTFLNGYYGINLYGSGVGASGVTGVQIDSNYFGTNVTNGPSTYILNFYYTTAPQITRNTMYSRSTSTYGCYIYYGSGNVNISRNTFQFLVGGTAIDLEYTNSNGESSGGSIVNNAISVGGTSTARGIYFNYSALMDVAFNSIYMNSSLANSASNTGIYTYGTSAATYKNISIYNNNIFSTNSYVLYATGIDASSSVGVIDTCNYNNFYSTGTNLAYVYPSSYTPANFTSFKGAIYTGSDANSVSGNPGFTSSSNLSPNTGSANAWIGSNMGTQVSWINVDINGSSRSTTVAGGAPDLGAYVYGVPSATPSNLTTTGTHATSGTEDFYFNGKKVASITWGSSGTLPTLTPRFYPGAWADTAGVGIAGAKFGNAYWGITASGGSGYSYDITLYYDPAQLGTVGSESDIRMAKRSGPATYWTAYTGSTSTVNTTTKALTTPGLTSFSEFIITDQNNPLPVTWLDFNGTKAGKEVLLTWSTASEINNSRFDVERSTNGKDFVKIGEVAGHGTTLNVSNYSFIDPLAAAQGVSTLYYRLRQVDYNNDAELSKVVVIDMNNGKVAADAAQLYPNPFTSTVTVTTVVTNEQPITITVVDQFGRLILTKQVNVTEGVNTLTLNESALWAKGVYFISIKGTQLNKTEKVIRY
ncbi:MAG: right-handed parallel beta-helix repeat-containing protein [Bacteroidia bacterium]|nr:right-handed parallel beta-helix repeat-containing protein [Bacteroidia bacterium]